MAKAKRHRMDTEAYIEDGILCFTRVKHIGDKRDGTSKARRRLARYNKRMQVARWSRLMRTYNGFNMMAKNDK